MYNIQQSLWRNLRRQKHELTCSASGDKQRDEAQKTLKRRLTIKKVIKVAGYRSANKVFFQEKVDQWQLDARYLNTDTVGLSLSLSLVSLSQCPTASSPLSAS